MKTKPPIVKEAYRLYLDEGLNFQQIADKLNSQGLTRKGGMKFTHNCLERMIGNEKYTGVLRCAEAINTEGIPRLIDDETFKRVLERREKGKRKGGAYKAKEDNQYILRGRAFCGECGEPLISEGGTSHTGKLFSYYRCRSAKKKWGCVF